MNEAAEYLLPSGSSDILLIADHASNHVPVDVDLRIDPSLLHEHIAVDIGVDPLTRRVARRLGCAAVLARVSRLVVDLNRAVDELNVIPEMSDGHVIAGNTGLAAEEREARLARFWWPYHSLVAARIEAANPRMICALHSFTPQLASRPEEERPWQVGILYNQDERAARIAIDLLRQAGVATGDNEPYSGKRLNATMDRHAEARGIPYIGFEIRQDLIDHEAGVERWSDRLLPVIEGTFRALA